MCVEIFVTDLIEQVREQLGPANTLLTKTWSTYVFSVRVGCELVRWWLAIVRVHASIHPA